MGQIRFLERKVACMQLTVPNYYSLNGNIISNDWYKKFTNNRGRPDLSLISVLSEIVYWYRPKKVKDNQTGNVTYVNKFLGDAWQTSYEHFEKKFGFSREKLRRIFVKLEQMGICAREFRNVKLRGQTYNNRLFIHLSSQFLDSCTDNKKFAELKTHENYVKPEFPAPKRGEGSPHFRGDHLIDNKNNIFKNRSVECKSNFYKNSFEKEESIKKVIRFNRNEIKELKDFYPLNKDDCCKLQSLSGREFSLNSMNEILLDMSKRLTNRYFKNKKAFLNYMGKVFSYEKRDAVKINNDNFKIRNNQTIEEIEAEEREKYLANIELSKEISFQWQLKKKLASSLEAATAYKLLKAFEAIDINNRICNLHLSKYLELTAMEEKIILQEIQAIYNRFDFGDERLGHIESLKIIMPAKMATTLIDQNRMEKTSLPAGTWGRVRQGLVEAYGEATDRNWFSKLTANVNEESKEIKLKAPTSFVKDWIETNYLDVIKRLVNNEQFKVSFY
ncbi:MAG: DnaA N-terminal domain-containing protein, partial [Candidatus Parvarchaeum sp.]